ncbi:hypothetical protein PHLGIDRAFT_326585 [Phlebiopsis gigantea 11061_1 CR5-6]|uniref:Uncharacterized protein n=1 Tax=Phlebiopsis gigantea (strain 11061_1 CR5-6) TaxID=745531 RepID=A0A0C3PAI0_PHLG1|nr:hypothetical protein PHLGIDRAFT_326585 [Phlebiopsis gigantea 11061_1 CR5-6]
MTSSRNVEFERSSFAAERKHIGGSICSHSFAQCTFFVATSIMHRAACAYRHVIYLCPPGSPPPGLCRLPRDSQRERGARTARRVIQRTAVGCSHPGHLREHLSDARAGLGTRGSRTGEPVHLDPVLVPGLCPAESACGAVCRLRLPRGAGLAQVRPRHWPTAIRHWTARLASPEHRVLPTLVAPFGLSVVYSTVARPMI